MDIGHIFGSYHACDKLGNLFTVDISTGIVPPTGNSGVAFTDIALNSAGELYGITFEDLYKIDPTITSASWIGYFGGALNSLVFDQYDVLWAADSLTINTIDTSTAARTVMAYDTYNSAGDLMFQGWLFTMNEM